jgi:head-tail adaptor
MAKVIGAGQLDRKIDFGRTRLVIDQETGEKTEEFSYTRKGVWARVDFFGTPSVGASEQVLSDQTTGKVKIEIFVRFFSDIVFEDFVVYKNKFYEVYSIQVVGNREFLAVRAEWRDDYNPTP